MLEIRIHGRGGQGNVAAAYLLAGAAFQVGLWCQAFPSFGAERRGAPVTAFVRIAERPILRRSQVRSPAHLIVQDDSLLANPTVLSGLLSGGTILANSLYASEELTARTGVTTVALPATAMALECLGRPLPNVALLAAFLALTRLCPFSALAKALEDRFPPPIVQRNLTLIERAKGTVLEGAWSALPVSFQRADAKEAAYA